MKLLGGLLVLVLLGVVLLPQTTAAQVPKYNNQLHVTGVVLPAQHVVVDEQGIILEIMSNTKKDVKPTVYTNRISKATTRKLTPEIYEQYRRLVPAGKSQVGVLYKRTAGTRLLNPLEALQDDTFPSYSLPFNQR